MMSLIEKWSGVITLPILQALPKKVGGNTISHVGQLSRPLEGKLFQTTDSSHFVFKTDELAPFNEILIRKKNSAKTLDNNKLALVCVEALSLSTLNEKTKFKWEHAKAFYDIYNDPRKIVESWKGCFQFKLENEDTGEPGLRKPQIGALHAISSYYTNPVKGEPANIVLPTGTGKTETMLANLIYNRCEKVLVLVPSNALRGQVTAKFNGLGHLPIATVVPVNIVSPKVACITRGIKSALEAREILKSANIIVATPDILNSSLDEATEIICAGCSDLFIDEAHHSTAKTWDDIRKKFTDKNIIQFTATPFRNDKRHIGGKIIYNYKLGDAQKSGLYKKIRLQTIEEFGDESKRDNAIASKALEILRRDIRKGNNHLMMARVHSKEKAREVLKIYERLAPEFKPVIVHSGESKTKNNAVLRDLIAGTSKIVVCVNMLGEGFDLPQLKIAAIHDGHKSLAITLQFVGRFTRKAADVGDAAVIVNIADPQTEKNIQRLYAEDSNWDEVIQRLSEAKIDEVIRLQDIIEKLKKSGDLHDQISLWNIKPGLATQIYKTNCEEWSPNRYVEGIPSNMTHWHSIAYDENLLVVLGIKEDIPKWGGQENLTDITHKLLLVHWKDDKQALFVYSNDFQAFNLSNLVTAITNSDSLLINGEAVFNVLNNVQLPLVRNLGASQVGAISFTSYFGPNVTEGLSLIEKRDAELNNIACLGYEDGERVIWGAAKKKGKIWSVKNGSISEWIDWCEKTWNKVQNQHGDQTNIVRDFLRPQRINSNHPIPAISVDWGEHAQVRMVGPSGVKLFFGEDEVPIHMVDLEVENVGTAYPVEISISSESNKSIYTFVIDSDLPSGYSYTLKSGMPVCIQFGKGRKLSLEEHVKTDPFIIRYADGTYSYNCFHISPKLNSGVYPQDSVESWDWKGVNLNEESMDKDLNTNSIQYKAFKQLENEYDFIFNDDASGEAADLVCLKELPDDIIQLCLVHCKNAYQGIVSNRIDNMYVVCGQAQKSIRVKHAGLSTLFKNCKRRDETWIKTGHTRVLKGDWKLFAYFRDKAMKKPLKFHVIIVQPGLSKSSLTTDVLRLLGTTELYLAKTTEGTFKVIVNS